MTVPRIEFTTYAQTRLIFATGRRSALLLSLAASFILTSAAGLAEDSPATVFDNAEGQFKNSGSGVPDSLKAPMPQAFGTPHTTQPVQQPPATATQQQPATAPAVAPAAVPPVAPPVAPAVVQPMQQQNLPQTPQVQASPAQSSPAQSNPAQIIPTSAVPTNAVPAGAAQAVLNPAAQVNINPTPATQPTLRLRLILASLAHEGWEPISTMVYGYQQDHLVAQDVQNQTPAMQLDPETSQALRAFHLDSYESSMLGEFKCVAMVHKVFKRGNRFIIVQGYEFQQPIGANAAYTYLRKGSTTVVTRGDGSSEDADSISFFQDNCFFRLTGTSLDDDESKEVITKLAGNVAVKIGKHAPPPAILSSLPVIDRVKGSEKVVLGPLTAGKLVSVPSIDALSIGSAKAAALADYQVFIPWRERMKLLCIDYGNDALAEQMFNQYQSKLTELNKAGVTVAAGRTFVFKQNKQFLFCELKPGGRIVVITGARKRESPALLARSM